jgi:serine/threonine protein kinase
MHLHDRRDDGEMARDLSLSNVFLDEYFEPGITDSGLSRMCQSSLRMTKAIGTPMFLARELLDDNGDFYDQTVDVSGYGVLLYRLFSPDTDLDDNCPSRGVQQMTIRILQGARLKPVPDIPIPFRDLIRRRWLHEPKDRPPFSDTVDLLLRSDDLVVDGTDRAVYHAYKCRVM